MGLTVDIEFQFILLNDCGSGIIFAHNNIRCGHKHVNVQGRVVGKLIFFSFGVRSDKNILAELSGKFTGSRYVISSVFVGIREFRTIQLMHQSPLCPVLRAGNHHIKLILHQSCRSLSIDIDIPQS